MGRQAQKFRALLNSGKFLVSPGVYDGYSIRLVEAAGYECASTSGAAISNALLGVPDAGVMGLSENVESLPPPRALGGHSAHRGRRHGLRQSDERALHRAAVRGGGCRGRQHRGPGEPQALRPHAGEGRRARRRDGAQDRGRVHGAPGRRVRDRRAHRRHRGRGHRRRGEAREGLREGGRGHDLPGCGRSPRTTSRASSRRRGIPVTINMGFGIRSRPTTPLIPIPRLKALGVRRISLPRMLPAASIRAMQLALAAHAAVGRDRRAGRPSGSARGHRGHHASSWATTTCARSRRSSSRRLWTRTDRSESRVSLRRKRSTPCNPSR